jgi:hypothetical protein
VRLLAALAPVVLLAACRAAAPPAVYSGAVAQDRGAFVIYGDTRAWIFGELWRRPAGNERRAVFKRLVEERPAFVVNTGDLVASGSSESDWQTFDEETAALRAAGIAYLPILGNHDLWPSRDAGLENWFVRFPFLEGRRWYEVRHAGVALLLLDSNEYDLSADEVAAQDAWLAERLAAADADPSVRCVLLACHHPAMTNSIVHGGSAWVREHFVTPIAAHQKVRAFFAGHSHSYEHFVENGVHFVVSGGGGAPLMDVAGPGGKYPDLYDGPRGHHFCRLTPRADRIDVEMVRLEYDGGWSVADAWSIPLP